MLAMEQHYYMFISNMKKKNIKTRKETQVDTGFSKLPKAITQN